MRLPALCLLGALLTACASVPVPTPTFFVPPTAEMLPRSTSPAGTAVPTALTLVPTPTPIASPTPAAPCTNDLSFVQDVTIPDGTTVVAGATVDKQWLVTNSGSCDWDARYRFKLTGGDAMGAATEQALFPARARTQATLRVVFTAPQTAGTYQSAWQAFSPEGIAFGQAVYVQIAVSP